MHTLGPEFASLELHKFDQISEHLKTQKGGSDGKIQVDPCNSLARWSNHINVLLSGSLVAPYTVLCRDMHNTHRHTQVNTYRKIHSTPINKIKLFSLSRVIYVPLFGRCYLVSLLLCTVV